MVVVSRLIFLIITLILNGFIWLFIYFIYSSFLSEGFYIGVFVKLFYTFKILIYISVNYFINIFK